MPTPLLSEPWMVPVIPNWTDTLSVLNGNGVVTLARKTTVWSVFAPVIQSAIFSVFWTATCICHKAGRIILNIVNRQTSVYSLGHLMNGMAGTGRFLMVCTTLVKIMWPKHLLTDMERPLSTLFSGSSYFFYDIFRILNGIGRFATLFHYWS